MAGVFVDGAFIKSWMGSAERSLSAHEYLAGRPTKLGALPLHYMGVLSDVPVQDGNVAEFWTGPCGANIIHLRPEDQDEQWQSYAGGDPRTNKKDAGRAYIGLTSREEFWILVSLESFRRHFPHAQRFVVNMNVPPSWNDLFRNPELSDAVQAADMTVVNTVITASREGKSLRVTPVVRPDLGSRLLAKLALAIGHKLLGGEFLATDYAKHLRKGFREAKMEKRMAIPIHGTGFFNDPALGGAEKTLKWPSGWVLFLHIVAEKLALTVITPSGEAMIVYVCDQPALVGKLVPAYKDGMVWITIPSLGEAVGPISLPTYIAHQTEAALLPQLSELAAKRQDPSRLPPCRPEESPRQGDVGQAGSVSV